MKQKQYTIQELSELTGFSRRTIRYYIQERLLDSPAGRGRGGFYYDSHVQRLSKIRELQNRGLKLESISKILDEVEAEPLDRSVPDLDIRFKSSDETLSHEAILSEPESAADTSRQVWVQYPVSDGVALYVRRDIDVRQRKKIDQILRLAGAILNKGEDNRG